MVKEIHKRDEQESDRRQTDDGQTQYQVQARTVCLELRTYCCFHYVTPLESKKLSYRGDRETPSIILTIGLCINSKTAETKVGEQIDPLYDSDDQVL